MSLHFSCPMCGREIEVDPQYAGRRIRCPGCGEALSVPGASSGKAADSSRGAHRAPSGRSASRAAAQAEPGVRIPTTRGGRARNRSPWPIIVLGLIVVVGIAFPLIRSSRVTALQAAVEQGLMAAESALQSKDLERARATLGLVERDANSLGTSLPAPLAFRFHLLGGRVEAASFENGRAALELDQAEAHAADDRDRALVAFERARAHPAQDDYSAIADLYVRAIQLGGLREHAQAALVYCEPIVRSRAERVRDRRQELAQVEKEAADALTDEATERAQRRLAKTRSLLDDETAELERVYGVATRVATAARAVEPALAENFEAMYNRARAEAGVTGE